MTKKLTFGWVAIILFFVIGVLGLAQAWKQRELMRSYLVNIFAGIATILVYTIIENYNKLKDSEKTWKRMAAMYGGVIFVVGVVAALMVLTVR